jgi:hypothetical protein
LRENPLDAPRHRGTPRASYWKSRLISDIQLNDDWKRINPDPKTFGIVATSIDELKFGYGFVAIHKQHDARAAWWPAPLASNWD